MKKITVVSRNRPLRGIILLLIILFLTLSGRSTCIKGGGKSKTKTGSSEIPEWSLNAPSGLTAVAVSQSQINLTWQYNFSFPPINGFEIERRTDGTNYELLTTTNVNVTSYSDPGPFLPFTMYYYRIRAFNTINDYSLYSNVASAITIRSEWQAIAAGESHSLAINTNNTLWGWGNNFSGQLDPGNYALTITRPTLLNNDIDWSTISAGYNHTLSIKTTGTLWSWGDNTYGQLGLGDTERDRAEPEQVGTDSGWSLAVGGEGHTVALKTGQTLWSWGDNTYGQLGIGSSTVTPFAVAPVQVGTDSDWFVVTAGGRHNLAIKIGDPESSSGPLWAWGWNPFGQLGDGTSDSRTTPLSIGTDSDWSKISAGYVHTIALKTDRTLYYWGTDASISSPTQIGTDTDWAYITAGGADYLSCYSLALKTSGTLWAWGYNYYGQLGLGDNNPRTAPVQITYPAEPWVTVTAGGYHSIGRTVDGGAQPPVGTLWVWGRNNYGQLGLGNTANQNVPLSLNGSNQPTNLIATAITWTQITLSWPDISDRETGFIIERSTSLATDYSLLATVGPNVTSYPDSTVIRGNTYYYRVKATYNDIDSTYSNVAVGVTILWEEKLAQDTPGSPSARQQHSMVWDGSRVIMFGGLGGTFKNDLWWYDPASGTDGAWIQQYTSITPSARYGHSMVWDTVGQRVIMFGGTPPYKNDLWWYYPVTNTWLQKFTAITPTARYGHSMVWDGQKVIMFGGWDASGFKNDLWWYDPASGTNGAWIKQIDQGAAGSPSARFYHSMVWDTINQKVIMFGGHDGLLRNDLWWYDPTSGTSGAWIKMIDQGAAGSPSARRLHSMVWDPVGARVIMFDGNDAFGYKNDLWWYDPASGTDGAWIQQYTSITPSARFGHSMVWDTVGLRLIMFGGYDSTPPYYKNDLWWWH